MDHTDCFTVTKLNCKPNSATIMPSNHDSASIACNHTLSITHVQHNCVINVTINIILVTYGQTNSTASTNSGRTPVTTTTTRNDPQRTFLLQENRQEHNLNRFREVESVDQSSMSMRQQACKQHFNTHTRPINTMENLLLNCQRRRIPSNLDFLASLQSEDYMQWIAGWNKNSRISTITSWRNLNKITGIQWTPKEGSNHIMCSHISIFDEIRAATSNWITRGGSAKTSNGTQQHNWWV